MSEEPTSNGVPERLVQATIRLLAEEGPSAIKARTVAAEAGMSTMVVYSHFGGIPELIRAVVDHGFSRIEKAFSQVPITEDPIADLFSMALATREIARANPHLYDLMFGLSTRATYRPTADRDVRRSGHSPAFQAAYQHVIDACARLAESGRVEALDPRVAAAALWSFVHGYVTLELGDHFTDFEDPVAQVMLPMGITFSVGLGDDPERARTSHETALQLHPARVAHSAQAPGSHVRG
ncbi:DNA-binding transcriptional regulator, AcrR family [Actinokineospora alba]|uniref:DNA-binding transcriptional regulator, AcrR family n=1 Tax=Actinokineospora alba TaxID=504798 RepID=A0A1H0FCJ9_9PSEU|nr:TetR/AcrR family transcriptional regulator [Actinokineospora alba]TDP69427.1 TetR family transcriptional regulator [Actinokineospora alba]SDI17031.1 DNA-binding transcriptional regulator, AcrR family [Actinokineospora alba]SDN92374.1 DNA-binding transcriptional regulator, AcrR family [Actinokineospora alba]